MRDTHHKTYARLGHEWLSDLQGICTPCHEWLSGKSNLDPCTFTRWMSRLKIVLLILAMTVFIMELL
jgi:hypothetical protein